MKDFIDLVYHRFDFLISQYGFHIVKITTSPRHFGNTNIRFETLEIGIEIVLDRGEVYIYLGNLHQPRDQWFDIQDVITFFAPKTETVYFSPQDLIVFENIRFQIDRLTNLIELHCEPILQGDLSMKDGIREVEARREERLKQYLKEKYPQLRNLK